MLVTGEAVGLAEWIIDDTCPVLFIFFPRQHFFIAEILNFVLSL